MDVGLMIEGQNGLTWPRWQGLLRAAEELGFRHVFRSDHFTNPTPPDKPSLELWPSLTYAAGNTSTIEFGQLVSPVTFRHPAVTARNAAAVDDLSGGRLVLGMGAGWQEREHRTFGVDFPATSIRFRMLDEYIQVVTLLLRGDEPVSFDGEYYRLEEAILLPRPQRSGGPRILVGGNGEKRTMPLAARYADEWNALFVTPQKLTELEHRFDELLDEAGRSRSAVKRSLMIGTIFARNQQALREQLDASGRKVEETVSRGLIVGTPDMWIEQLRAYASTGIDRIMLQWLDLDNIEGLEIVGREVLPHL